jgi:hypothetical protein
VLQALATLYPTHFLLVHIDIVTVANTTGFLFILKVEKQHKSVSLTSTIPPYRTSSRGAAPPLAQFSRLLAES